MEAEREAERQAEATDEDEGDGWEGGLIRDVDRNGDQDEPFDEDDVPTYRFIIHKIEELAGCVLPVDLFLAILETPLAPRPCGETHTYLPKCQMATRDWLVYGTCLGEAVDNEVAKAQEVYKNRYE